MALKGRRIENFLELWWLVASRVVDIWVSSISFQKSDIGWPQQPLTKKLVNFNVIYFKNLPNQNFSKHQNKAKFKNLDDSKVPSRNFPNLRTSAALMTSTASTTSMASMTLTALFHEKYYWLWWLDHSCHQNDQYRSLFGEWTIKNPIFYWY